MVKNKTVLWRHEWGADIPHYLTTTTSSSSSLRCHLLPCPFSSPIHPQLSIPRSIVSGSLNPARPLPLPHPTTEDSSAVAWLLRSEDARGRGAFLECSVPGLLLAVRAAMGSGRVCSAVASLLLLWLAVAAAQGASSWKTLSGNIPRAHRSSSSVASVRALL
jgi:hypothetical protein